MPDCYKLHDGTFPGDGSMRHYHHGRRGGIAGRVQAMKELLTRALKKARKHDTDGKTLAATSKYPYLKKREVTDEFDITRE